MRLQPLDPPARDDVEIIARETLAESYGRLYRLTLRHRQFEGGWSNVSRRDCFDSGPAVIVLPYDPIRDEIVLIKQFRIAPYLAGDDPWMWECVAGRIDKERASAEDIAHMEGREEAGLTFRSLERMPAFFTSPGLFAEKLEAFCGIIEGRASEGVFGLAHEHEDIRAEIFSAEAALKMAAGGEIVSGPTLACLFWLVQNRARLRQTWVQAQT